MVVAILQDIHAGTGCEHKVSHTSIDHQQTEDLKLLTECKSPYHQQVRHASNLSGPGTEAR